jgi:hypothetical protein
MNKQYLCTKRIHIATENDRSEHTKPLFGKMNVQQMIEHMGYAFRQASGLIPLDALNNEEITAKMYRFMMSERPFKDNTPNPLFARNACSSSI